jgi:glycosyltransferase involved in cell wall biosynthesis
MAEAMACGTPVLGLARGAVVEVVEHGVTGFVSEDIDGLVDAIPRLHQINRAACRARVERLFSQDAVVDSYLDVYGEMLVGARRKISA